MSTNLCTVTGCDRPTHDGWYVCEQCGRDLSERLAEVRWMLDELDVVIAKQTRYTSSAGKIARASDEQPLPFHVKASEQRAYLITAIATAARLVIDEHPEWLSDRFWVKRDEPRHESPPLAAAWLEHRITGLRLHPLGGEARDEIMRHWVACEWLIDRPAERRYLGECATDWEGNDCGGRIYQRGGKPEAKCDTCSGEYDADRVAKLEADLIERLNGHLVTAAEAGRLSTYMDLSMSAFEVRKRVNRWHSDKRLEAVGTEGSEDSESRFRFSEIHWLLVQDEARHAAGRSA